ncbi:hypothetical protein PQX77_009805 [Marasmius sp. AFHP31]|nr:hypothetical protein PQX77_009805 [Marasmius sp. AFHP31]
MAVSSSSTSVVSPFSDPDPFSSPAATPTTNRSRSSTPIQRNESSRSVTDTNASRPTTSNTIDSESEPEGPQSPNMQQRQERISPVEVEAALASATSFAVLPNRRVGTGLNGSPKERNHQRSFLTQSSSFLGAVPTSPTQLHSPYSVHSNTNSEPGSVANTAANSPMITHSGLPVQIDSRPISRAVSTFNLGSNSGSAPALRQRPRMRSHLLPSLMHRSTSAAGATNNPYMSDAPAAGKDGHKAGTHLVSKPWLLSPSPRIRISYWLVYACILVGFLGGVAQCVVTYFNVSRNRLDNAPMCIVLDEDFSNAEKALGPSGSFRHEVALGGFGNGEFDMTTSSSKNSWVDEENGWLYIKPTLTADEDLGGDKGPVGWDGVFASNDQKLYVYNLTDCTFNETAKDGGFIEDPKNPGQKIYDMQGYLRSCSAVSNSTSGVVLPPAQSARLTTRKTASIKHGRVEVRARLPRGDWLWPAIWMLPKDSVYGDWPRSGEIDIVESRGNSLRYTARGRNYVQGALNWGPTPELNAVSKSYSWWSDKRKGFDEDFHTYVLEWSEKWVRIYVDTRLHTLLEFKFPTKPGGLFQFGDFPENFVNKTNGQLGPLLDPWQGNSAGPFDQEFYLILNVAVGGTGGWFPEVQGDKPWLNQAGQEKAMRDFALARDRWLPSWLGLTEKKNDWGDKSGAMIVDSVRMWQHC